MLTDLQQVNSIKSYNYTQLCQSIVIRAKLTDKGYRPNKNNGMLL
jgi:hypothetical protein